MGLNGALAVLVAVSYGRKDIEDCERILQRGRVICFLASIPLFVIQISCYPVLRAMGILPEVAWPAAQYGFFLFIAMVLYCQFDCYRGYLNAVGQTKVLQYAVSSTILFHLLLCYLLTKKLGMGVLGVSLSTMTTVGCNLLFVMLHSWKVSEFHIPPIPTKLATLLSPKDLKVYMTIALPSIVMIMAEWIGVEILIVIAANISMDAVGAMSISYNFHSVIYMIPYGFQLSITAVVGNYIGEGNEKYGKLTALIGIIEISIITTLCGFMTR